MEGALADGKLVYVYQDDILYTYTASGFTRFGTWAERFGAIPELAGNVARYEEPIQGGTNGNH